MSCNTEASGSGPGSDPDPGSGSDPDPGSGSVPVLHSCKKCNKEILKGAQIVEKFYSFYLCSECIKTEEPFSCYIEINEIIHNLNVSDIKNIYYESSSSLQGGISMYYYNIYMYHKTYGHIGFNMYINDMFKILTTIGEYVNTECSFLRSNYQKYIENGKPVFKVDETFNLSTNCVLHFDKIYEKVTKTITIEYDEKIETDILNSLLSLKNSYDINYSINQCINSTRM